VAFLLRRYDLHHFLSANRFWEKTVALKTMSIDKLVKLRDQVEAALASKVTEQRRAVESELSKLGGFSGGPRRAKVGRGGARGSVAPKYRNPDNPSETWPAEASSRAGSLPLSRKARRSSRILLSLVQLQR
jgi:hypothetical protein